MTEILDYYEDEFGEEIPIDALVLKMLIRFKYNDTNFVSYENTPNGSKAFEKWAVKYHIPGNKRTMTVEKRFLDLYEYLVKLRSKQQQKNKQPKQKPVQKAESIVESKEPIKKVTDLSDDELDVTIQPTAVKPEIVESIDVDDSDNLLKLSDILIDRGRDVYVDGKLIQKYQLANTNKRKVSVSDSSIFIIRDMFTRYLKNSELLDHISWNTLLDSYIVYMAASSKESVFEKPTDWTDWCIANAFANVRNLQSLSNALNGITDINEIIYNHSKKFSYTFRWYVFLSTVTPSAFKNYEIKELLRKQDHLDDSLLVITGLLASLLSVDDEATWTEALIGDDVKRYRKLIEDLRLDILKPYKTILRTSKKYK